VADPPLAADPEPGHHAREEQRPEAVGESGPERARREHDDAAHHGLTAPDAVGDAAAHLGCVVLAHRYVHGDVFVAVALSGGLEDEGASALDLDLALGQHGLDELCYSLLLGTVCLTLIGAMGSALTVSIRRGGLLMSLLIIPLNVPVLIFGTTAVSEAIIGGNPSTWLALLGGLAMGSLALVPLAISAALRVSLDN